MTGSQPRLFQGVGPGTEAVHPVIVAVVKEEAGLARVEAELGHRYSFRLVGEFSLCGLSRRSFSQRRPGLDPPLRPWHVSPTAVLWWYGCFTQSEPERGEQ
jgi:hypothetical protein